MFLIFQLFTLSGNVTSQVRHTAVMLQKYLGLNTYVPPHPKGDKELWGKKKNGEERKYEKMRELGAETMICIPLLAMPEAVGTIGRLLHKYARPPGGASQ